MRHALASLTIVALVTVCWGVLAAPAQAAKKPEDVFGGRGIVATASFYILGEAKKFSGKVEFSEDEANKKGDIDQGDADSDAAKAAEEKKAAEPKKKGK